MASSSVSELIVFIAAVSVAASVSGAMVTTVGGISNSLDDHGHSVSAAIETNVEIISDPGSGAVYDGTTDEVRLLVKNTGGRTLPTKNTSVEILVDGRYVAPSDYTVTTLGGGAWREGAVVRVTVDQPLGAGDHRATVIVQSDRETIGFRV